MPIWTVELRFSGTMMYRVEADTEEDAVAQAEDVCRSDQNDVWDIMTVFVQCEDGCEAEEETE